MTRTDDKNCFSVPIAGKETVGGGFGLPIGQRIRSAAAFAVKERMVKNFIDLIILCKLKDGPFCGYNMVRFIHNEFDIFLSPGTIYPVLYGLEKDGLVRSKMVGKKRMYSLADPSAAERGFSSFKDVCSKMLKMMA